MSGVLAAIKQQATSYEDADFLDIVFGRFRDKALSGALPVVLFGAGSAGKGLLPTMRRHGVRPECFCETHPVNSSFCDLPVISFLDLLAYYRNSLVVITTNTYRDEISRTLLAAGIAEERILTISQPALYFYSYVDKLHWSEEHLIAREADLSRTHDLLADQKSRNLLVSRIAMLSEGADFGSFNKFLAMYSAASEDMGSVTSVEAYLQFNNDVIALKDGECFVDGGAFLGDSLAEFLKACECRSLTYEKVICYEPDELVFEELQRFAAGYRNISFRRQGLFSSSARVSFLGSDIAERGGSRILDTGHASAGATTISTATIDEQLIDENVTLIKMDIEGAEPEALRGGIKTIRKCRPKLIISVYHNRDDIFEIPLLVHQMVPEYKLHIRHFSRLLGETTLLAVV